MPKVTLTIDGKQVQAEKGTPIIEVAREIGIDIPSLCYLKGVNHIGACRVCLVQIEGSRILQASCHYPATEGLVIHTNTPEVRAARKEVVSLLISNHPMDCLSCLRNQNCELQAIAKELNIKDILYEGERASHPDDAQSVAIHREPEKCILCRRCVSMCSSIQTTHVLNVANRGFNAVASPAFEKSLADAACTACGQCVNVCPTAALRERDDTDQVWDALNDPDKYVVVQVAPSVRVTLGEEFGYPLGTVVTGKLVSALRRLGFNGVFDTNLSADLTVVEEGHEFIEKLLNQGPFPHLTSCSTAWVKFCEHYFPEFLPNLSTVKSPQAIFGALAKTYHATNQKVDPAKMVVVSIMPCTAKKYEKDRPEMVDSGYKDVDISITTRELARMLREAAIDLERLQDEEFDQPLGESSGSAAIFGATGGVMEAVIRTVYEMTSKKKWKGALDSYVESIRGIDGIKESEIELPQGKIKFAVAHGTGNARLLLDSIKKGERFYHFIEIMGCPGGCVGGGGQPILSARDKWKKTYDYRMDRADALYKEREGKKIRHSHDNPVVKRIYDEFIGEPLGVKARKYLHTSYTPRTKYGEVVTYITRSK